MQASTSKFLHTAAGTQCGSNCLVALVKASLKNPLAWTSDDIDDILVQGQFPMHCSFIICKSACISVGDVVHLERLGHLGWPGTRKEANLVFDELPDFIDCLLDNNRVQADVFKLVHECVYTLVENFQYSLEKALTFNLYHIVRIRDQFLGIVRGRSEEDSCFIFNPHSIDVNGQTSPEGSYLLCPKG